jgi:hypothetical protein
LDIKDGKYCVIAYGQNLNKQPASAPSTLYVFHITPSTPYPEPLYYEKRKEKKKRTR